MPPELHKAHQELDSAVDKAYKPSGFVTTEERIIFLFSLYQKLLMPLIPMHKSTKKRKINIKHHTISNTKAD
ncbi:MAG: hypothetical protein ACJARD_000854 [Alphaproteobacteria bacterium]|jgi:hypothetical protein